MRCVPDPDAIATEANGKHKGGWPNRPTIIIMHMKLVKVQFIRHVFYYYLYNAVCNCLLRDKRERERERESENDREEDKCNS